EHLTFGSGASRGAAVSRDGKVIAFSALNETLNLEEVSFDAEKGSVLGTERQLTAGNNRVGLFDTSPDGKAAAYGSERGAGSHVWRIDPPAPPIRSEERRVGKEGRSRWSADH